MKQMIPILKVGQYTDSQGKQFSITPEMLKEIATCYQENSAPLVKGHPTSESPAVGWIHRLSVIGDKLYAAFTDVQEEFKEELKKNLFKNISASLFFPTSPSNPQQGKFCLRHVGALGASRPAIPNLGTLQDALSFSEHDELINFISSHKKSIGDECQKLIHRFQKLNEINNTNTILEELQHARKEIQELKDQLQRKYIEDQIQLLMIDKKLNTEHKDKITNIIMQLSEKGLPPQEIVASFSEFLDTTSTIMQSHRFEEYTHEDQTNSMDFSEYSNLENSAIFADEVDKLCHQGMARYDAYKQAKINLNKGGF